jgi:hypothetical protein
MAESWLARGTLQEDGQGYPSALVVCLVHLVDLVHLVSLVQPNIRDKPNKPNNDLVRLMSFSVFN